MQTDINPASRKKVYVRVLRNVDDVEQTITYRAYQDLRNSMENTPEGSQYKKLTLIGQCNEGGTLIPGNPDLKEEDKQSNGK